ncbi:hypothetical protein SELMODRAFT_450202 [Selaginella moellendorffii]|uniref:Uncharacterized protein SmTPK4_1 n=1 Tax=Selaginella moellendorffii TaxID=88036 RepID=D8S907_SELML|nr:two-pore potassium channel 1 [Selaginella moellendorffii]XP_024540637.1 two-pore potassium channel 1 [Selaginella moellendorffii]EFJ19259.1 hypothetical protein SELMODRAFT_450202 [Selaginella moellendorffii]|eukprot:XP_002979857.1 two-pore potassium channel 1 [Selaginella moellendorffii]
MSNTREPLLVPANDPKDHHLKKCSSDTGANYSLDRQRSTGKPPQPELPPVANLAILTPQRAAMILLIYIAVGLLCFIYVKHGFEGERTVNIVDALYFCAVTMTTVGYGDLVPHTSTAKLFTCAFVFLGFGLIGLIIGNAANYFVEKQQRLLEKALEEQQQLEQSGEARITSVQHKVLVAAGLVVIVLGAGIGILMGVEGLGFVDSFYCVCVTVTTLGYGDRAFRTEGGRICAVFWILASTACVAQFMLYLAELITEERQHAIAKWVLSRKVTISDVEAADIDKDGRLSAPEFVIYKLMELGKIQDADVKAILDDFREQDADQSGSITISDVTS